MHLTFTLAWWQRYRIHSPSIPVSACHCDGGTASESEEESAASTVPPSDPDIPMAIATPASPPGADDSGSSEGRTVPLSGSVEVPCHELTSPSDVPVQAPRRSSRLRRLPGKLKDYELH
ncbi:hypothetical protein Q8A67_020265 [Cirrhinus molitorella]|uniref:Uncharacterized protein n=1 Tax=Cirrhinus molitorella TaxID=172907 RepID=A0AA88TDU8_9TELE|nr:hypothetical protein Q8A67_020265 [Cirrhinus molitorella]